MAVLLTAAYIYTDTSWQALPMGALAMLAGTALFEWQIVRPIENVATQALKVATGERDSVRHLNRSDELGLTFRAVGQLGLMCCWLNNNDIVAQVQNVTQLIARISQLTLEQTGRLYSLTRVVDELNRITQKNAELMEESAQVSAMVKHRASRLEDAI